MVEDQYVLHIIPPKLPLNVNQQATTKLQNPPPNWSFECDEELVRFLSDNAIETYHGNAKKFIEKIEVSTVSILYCNVGLLLFSLQDDLAI